MGRKRNEKPNPSCKTFGFLLYPEDMPPTFDFQSFAAFFDAKVWVSPLHDRDYYHMSDLLQDDGSISERYLSVDAFNEATGSELTSDEYTYDRWLCLQKKPHYHVLLTFGSTVRLNKVQKLTESAFKYCEVVGIPYVMTKNSLVRSVEYLIHFNNPEKAQYSKEDIQCFQGADFKRCFLVYAEDELQQLIDLALITGIDELNRFLMYVTVNFPQLRKAATHKDNFTQISAIIRSNKFAPVYVQNVDSNGELQTIGALQTVNQAVSMSLGGSDKYSYVNQFMSSAYGEEAFDTGLTFR